MEAAVYKALTLLQCYGLVWSAMVAWGSLPGEGVCDWQPQQDYLKALLPPEICIKLQYGFSYRCWKNHKVVMDNHTASGFAESL